MSSSFKYKRAESSLINQNHDYKMKDFGDINFIECNNEFSEVRQL